MQALIVLTQVLARARLLHGAALLPETTHHGPAKTPFDLTLSLHITQMIGVLSTSMMINQLHAAMLPLQSAVRISTTASGSCSDQLHVAFDFPVTLTCQSMTPILNAGAMLWRRSEAAQQVLDAWTAEQYAGNQKYDQDALNRVTASFLPLHSCVYIHCAATSTSQAGFGRQLVGWHDSPSATGLM